MIKVLWSDDDFGLEANKQREMDVAFTNSVNLIAKQTWEETLKELEDNWDAYDLLILDGKGQKKVDSKNNDTQHLTEAIGWIERMQAKGKYIPVIIYTGYHEAIAELYEVNHIINGIIKKPEVEKLYEQVRKCIADSPKIRIRLKHIDVWQIFENGILDTHFESRLMSLILKEEDVYQKSDFNLLRELLENLLLTYHGISNSFLPNDILNEKGKPNLDWSIRLLKGLRTEIKHNGSTIRIIERNFNSPIPDGHHIGYCFEFVKNTSSALSHSYSYSYTKRLFLACLEALLEILVWSNEFITTKYPNHY